MAAVNYEISYVKDRIIYIWKITDFPVYFSVSSFTTYDRAKRKVLRKFFTFEGEIFSLRIQFNKSPETFSVYLDKRYSSSNLEFAYTIRIKDKNNSNKYQSKNTNCFVELSALSEDECESVLPDDCLTVACEVISVYLPQERNTDPAPSSRVEDLTNDLKNLFSTMENSDVVLRVDEQEILAHSAILSARSSYFSAMFKHDMLESRSREIIITDFGASAISYLIRYLYTGTLEDLKDLPGDLMTELYAAADKYVVKGLKDMCLLMMLTTLSESNIEAYTTLALTHEEQRLTDAVVKYFARNEKLIKSDMWKKLERMYPTLAILVLNDVTKKMNKED